MLYRMGDCMNFCNKRLLITRILLSVLTISLVVFIFANSSQNAQDSSTASGRLMNFLNNIFTTLNINFTFTQQIVRTLAHFSEFGLLGVLSISTSLSFFFIKARTLIYSTLFSVSIAIIDECIQLFSDGRAFQFEDLAIDFAGAMLGIVGIFIISLLIYYGRLRIREGKTNG